MIDKLSSALILQLDDLFEYTNQSVPRDSIDVDSAEDLVQGAGNREKVEQLCTSIQYIPDTNKLVLRKSLNRHSNTSYYKHALQHFENLLESTIRLACAFSLLANEIGEPKALKRLIEWEMIEISSSVVNLNLSLFRQSLISRSKFATEADKIIAQFSIWQEKVKQAELSCVRWMCHGHIGLRFIRAVFGRCVFEACLQDKNDSDYSP